jgi:hypothetical protein
MASPKGKPRRELPLSEEERANAARSGAVRSRIATPEELETFTDASRKRYRGRYDFDNSVDVSEFPLTPATTLRCALVRSSDGSMSVGLRKWVKTKDTWEPAHKQGLMLPSDTLEWLIGTLKHAQATLSERADEDL